ncbi:MAG: hypothetical protein ACYCO3_05420 [Mycobacteriales bacterium]
MTDSIAAMTPQVDQQELAEQLVEQVSLARLKGPPSCHDLGTTLVEL